MKYGGFVAAGCVLFALPFLSMGVGSTHHDGAAPHMDHTPRYGGLLLMVDDHHLEIVEMGEMIEVHTSDARRRPLRPQSGRIVLDDGRVFDLEWRADRLAASGIPRSGFADYEVLLDQGEVLSIRVPRSDGVAS